MKLLWRGQKTGFKNLAKPEHKVFLEVFCLYICNRLLEKFDLKGVCKEFTKKNRVQTSVSKEKRVS